MNLLHSAFQMILSASWRTSVVILALVVLRLLVRGRIPAQLWFVAWIVIAVRLLVPVTVPAAWSPFNLGKVVPQGSVPASALASAIAGRVAPSLITSLPVDLPPAPTQAFAPPPRVRVQLDPAWLWPVGAAILLVGRMLTWYAFRRRLQASRQPADERLAAMVSRCGSALERTTSPGVYETTAVDGPALFGIFQPQLLFPPGFAATLSDDELRLVVLHELGHWRRRDLLSQALMQISCAMHWFNPVVWLASRLARQDCEFACDEFVIRNTSQQETPDYGATLLKVLGVMRSSRRPAPLLGILENRTQLKRRLQLIIGYRTPSFARALAGVVLLAFLGAVCLTRETRAQSSAPAPASLPTKRLVLITINANGLFSADDDTVPLRLPELLTRLRGYGDQVPAPEIQIKVDPQVRYETLQLLMTELEALKLTRFSLTDAKETPDSIVAEPEYAAKQAERIAMLQQARADKLAEQNQLRQKAIDDSLVARGTPVPQLPEHTLALPSVVITVTAEGLIYVNHDTLPLELPNVYARLRGMAVDGQKTVVHIHAAPTVQRVVAQLTSELGKKMLGPVTFVMQGPWPSPGAKPPFSYPSTILPAPGDDPAQAARGEQAVADPPLAERRGMREQGPANIPYTDIQTIPSVIIDGQVVHPGRYDVDSRSNLLTVVDLVTKAGGFTDQADPKVQIVRHHGNDTTVVFADVGKIFKGNAPMTRAFLLEPGDVITVRSQQETHAMRVAAAHAGVRKRNLGPTGVDARWTNYGEYLQRLIEAVQGEWDRILESGYPNPPSGKVSVKFTLDSKGRIAAILDHATSGTDEHGTAACMAAITNGAPYRAWTPDMIATLGDSQDLTFTFYYQP